MADDIFDGELDVDFSELRIDLQERNTGHILYQFLNSCVFNQFLYGLTTMEQILYDAAVDVLEFRTLAKAEGVNLDVLGRLVGQPRILLNAEDKQWFGFDNDDESIGGYDQAPNWVQNAPLFGDLPADDPQYRLLILSKIFKNIVKVGSVPEIIRFVQLLTGFNISLVRTGPMDLRLIVPENMPLNTITTITRVFDDKTADRKYLIPMPATGRLTGYMKKLDPAFTWDKDGGGWDQAKYSVEVPL